MKLLLPVLLLASMAVRAQVADVPADDGSPAPVSGVPAAVPAAPLPALPPSATILQPLPALPPLSAAPALGSAFDGRRAAALPNKEGDRRAENLRDAARSLGRPSGASASASEAMDERYFIEVAAGSREERSAVADAGVSIEEVRSGAVTGIADRGTVQRLRTQGFNVLRQKPLSGFRPQDFPAGDEAFHTYDQTAAGLAALAQSRPDLVTLFSIGDSIQGRKLNAVRITSSKEPEGKLPAAVFLGAHHAREHLSVEVPLMLAQYLVAHAEEPEVARLLSTREVYVVPMVNPDGCELDTQDRKYHMWRKNARKNKNGSIGVDLNRNYGWGWGGGGASKDPASEIYRGPSAFSEPETQAVKAFIDGHPNIRTLLSYHTFSELILYPWGHTYDPVDGRDKQVFETMARTMAQWNGYTPEQSSDLYIASGDTTDWAYGAKKIFAFTFELTPKSMEEGGFYPGAAAIQTTFDKNLQAALYLIEKAEDPYSVLKDVHGGPFAGPVPPSAGPSMPE